MGVAERRERDFCRTLTAKAVAEQNTPWRSMTPTPTPRSDELREEIRTLEGRDLHLWSIGILLLLVVAAGFIAVVLPNLMWDLGTLRLSGRYLPQLLFGFIALVVLFNIYALDKKRALRHMREELLRELVRSQANEMLSLTDPLTEVFNRRYLDYLIAKETNRADRLGTSLTFLIIDVDCFKAVNTQFGHLVGDRVLVEVAKLLKGTFRASDTVVRYGGDEFLVGLPDTNEEETGRAMERLLENVESWNRTSPIEGYTMRLSCGLAGYTKGAKIEEVLEAADKRMFEAKGR